MKPVYTISSLEQLRALANPLRVEILNQITDEARTMAQVAPRLGLTPSKLYFHIAELETNGLVEVVRTQTKGNLTERYYQAVAEHFTVDKTLFRASGLAGLEAFHQSITSVLDLTAMDLQKLIVAGRVTFEEAALARAIYTDLRLGPERLDELHRRLIALLVEFTEPEIEDETARLTVVLYRLTHPQEKPDES